MKRKVLGDGSLVIYLCFALNLGIISDTFAAEFIADYVQIQHNWIKNGIIYVKDGQYRLELDDPLGPKVIFIVDSAVNQTKVLYPSYKVYQEMRCDDRLCCLNDPIQSAKAMLKFYSISSEGYDRVEGYICDKQLIHMSGERIMNRWMSEKLKFPLKLVAFGREQMSTELRNIKEGAVEQGLLTVPSEYQKTSAEVIRTRIANDSDLKEKIAIHNKSKPQISEISKLMAAGHEVRFVLAEGTMIKAKVRNGLHGPFKWYALPFKDGEVVITAGQTHFDGPAELDYKNSGQANAIVFGATAGEVYMNLELTGKMPMVLATSEEFHVGRGVKKSWPVNNDYQKLVVNIIGEKVLEKEPTMTKGKMIVSRKVAGQGVSKEAYDFVVQEGETQTLEFTAAHGVNNFDLAILEGKVKVNILVDNRSREEISPALAAIDWRNLFIR